MLLLLFVLLEACMTRYFRMLPCFRLSFQTAIANRAPERKASQIRELSLSLQLLDGAQGALDDGLARLGGEQGDIGALVVRSIR